MNHITWIPITVAIPENVERVILYTPSTDKTKEYRIIASEFVPKMIDATFYAILSKPVITKQ